MAIIKEIEIKTTEQGSDKAKKNIQEVNKEIQNTSKVSKESGEAVNKMAGAVDSATGGMISKFKGLTSTLGLVTNGFKSLRVAIAATGLGALVLVIAAVTQAFRSSESGQNKFAKLMGIIGTVVGNATDILSNFGEALIAISTGKLGEAKKAFDRATDGIKNFTKETAKEIKISQQISDARAKADMQERDLAIARAKADRLVADLREKALDREKYNSTQRIEFLRQASKVEENITNKEIKLAELRRDALIAENKQSNSNKEALNAEAQAKVEVTQLETKRLNLQKALTSQISSLKQQEKAENNALFQERKAQLNEQQKLREEAAKKEIEDEQKRNDEIARIRLDFAKKLEDLEAETELEKIALEERRAIAELDRLNATNEQKLELEKYYARLRNTELEKIQQEEFEKQLEKATEEADNEQLSFEERLALLQEREFLIRDMFKGTEEEKLKLIQENQAKIDAVKIASENEEMQREQALSDFKQNLASDTLSLLGGLAKQGSKLGKAVAISQATISTFQGVNKTLAETTDFTPTQSLRFLNAALVGASGLANISKIVSTPEANVGGSVGAAASQSVPSAPSFNLVQGTGTNQIAETLNRDTQPVRAYVVSSEVTTQQALDRNIQANASI